MINNSEFAERLKKVMDYYQLSAATFADKIGVQRSSISHLLSGRNKPSLDFVLKVLEEFKGVELYWLLNGKGTFPKHKSNHQESIPESSISDFDLFLQYGFDIDKLDAEIDRIVIFYKDGTFKNYKSKLK